MSDGTVIVGGRNGSDVIAGQCTGPLAGTEVQAQDVNSPLTSVENDIVTIRDGNVTVKGCWTFTGANGVSQAAITCTGANSAGIVSTGTGNGQGALCQGAGNGAGVEGTGGSGANGYGGLFNGGSGGADAVQANGTAGNANGITATGHGQGKGGEFTGGGTNGHGVEATAGGANGAGVKAVAFASGQTSLWVADGLVLFDTNVSSPNVDPGANTLWSGNVPKAWGRIGTDGAGGFTGTHSNVLDGFGVSAAFQTVLGQSCIVVTLSHAMSNTDYSVALTVSAPAGGIILATEVTGARTATTFAIQFAGAATGYTIASIDPTAQSLGLSVQVFGNH